jgi:hypothetical protein
MKSGSKGIRCSNNRNYENRAERFSYNYIGAMNEDLLQDDNILSA